MKKPWSLSTTVRNPERLRDFLRVLKSLEGQPFNTENQIKYQILLIKNRIYRPTDLTKEQNNYFEDIEKEMPLSVAEGIFNNQKYEDPAMRGRNSVAPLNKMGLCVAKNSAKIIEITSLGNYFLSDNYDLGEIFFIHFLKWQLPNLDSRTFSSKDGFSIKPFIGTLHLINEVNKKWVKLGNKPVGISKEEFSIFAPTLIDYQEIDKQADKLIEFRVGLRNLESEKDKKQFKDDFKENFAKFFLNTNKKKEVEKLLNNLRDYGDNAIRYFRLTRYIYIRGGGFYIDLEPRRSIEIEKLLLSDNAAPQSFKNRDEYIQYLADINQPVLPWETKQELEIIANGLNKDVGDFANELKSKSLPIPFFKVESPTTLDIEHLKKYIAALRAYRRKLQELENHFESQDIEKIKEYIALLSNIHHSDNKKSIELERLSVLALNALNDALDIKPNYPVGDDNEPTFTAPAGKPDIECFYQNFNLVCEVTMLTDRSQWYNEGQPVMRHIRDFEDLHSNKKAYCLFIAPRLHQDTMETFWMAIKYGYKGTAQKIIPFSISQLIKLLGILLVIRQQGRKLKHQELAKLYDDILDTTNRVADSEKWIENIPNVIDSWQTLVLAKS